MAQFESSEIRNIGLIGHGGSGKTSLGEAMLFSAGATTRLGNVEEENTILDWEPEELKRHASVSTGLASLEWTKTKVNVLDTPGDANFLNDSRNCLTAADTALVVVSAVGGVEVGTERMWSLAKELGLPRVLFINKLDRERANPEGVLGEIKEVLASGAAPLQVPIGKEGTFQGVVDVLTGVAYLYAGDGSGKATKGEVPADLADVVSAARAALVESVAENDETLMEKYFDAGDLSNEEILSVMPSMFRNGDLVPVLYGAASKNIGTALLLDFIRDVAPSPLVRGVVKATVGGEETDWEISPSGPLAAQVFKTVADPYAGQLTIFRVWSGQMSPDSTFENPNQSTRERYGQPLGIQGRKQEPLDAVVTGDIAAVAKLKETKTGDSMIKVGGGVQFPPLEPLQPIITFAITSKNKGDEEKMMSGLNRLTEEDPSLSVGVDEQSRDILLSGMGHVHVEVVLARLKRKFGVEVNLDLPKVPYRETVTRKVTGIEGKHKKQSGGRGQFGVCFVDMEPMARGGQYEFEDAIFGGSIPRQYIPAVDKGIQEAMVKGPLSGNPVVDVKIRLYDGKYHNVDSSEMAFKIAGSLAFKEGFMKAGPILLEPVMSMEIVVPEECMGDVMGDITSRRGKVEGMNARGRYQVISAQCPMAEVLQYAPDLHSMTSGRGTFTMSVSHFDPVPNHLTEKVIAQLKADAEG